MFRMMSLNQYFFFQSLWVFFFFKQNITVLFHIHVFFTGLSDKLCDFFLKNFYWCIVDLQCCVFSVQQRESVVHLTYIHLF